MTTSSAHDIAREIRSRLPNVPTKKLHKLLYYVQGWHLATHGEPAFSNDIRAWDMGPVVSDLWADEKHERARPSEQPIGSDVEATVGFVLERYGELTGKDLEDLTHAEAPWESAYRSPLGDLITVSSIREWFEPRREAEKLRSKSSVYRLKPPLPPEVDSIIEDFLSRH